MAYGNLAGTESRGVKVGFRDCFWLSAVCQLTVSVNQFIIYKWHCVSVMLCVNVKLTPYVSVTKAVVHCRYTGDMVFTALNQHRFCILGSIRPFSVWGSLHCLLGSYLHQSFDHHSGTVAGLPMLLFLNKILLFFNFF